VRLRCPQCATEYDLRPPGGGRSLARIKFRCTNCGAQLTDTHLLTEQEPEPESPDLPFASDPVAPGPADPVPPEDARPKPQESAEGALLKQEGKVYHVRSLATIQRWIVERRVLREDLISTGGGTWEPVGSHPDLDVFFHMVERLDELELGSRGLAEPHSTRPPLADETPVGNAWSDPDSWDGGPPDLDQGEQEEDADSEPSDIVYAVREEDEDPDSDLSFEPRSPPLAALEEDVLATEERSMSADEVERAFTDELPDFPDAPIDDAEPTLMDDPGGYVEPETEQQVQPEPEPEPEPAPSFFSDDKFFGPAITPDPEPDPVPQPAPGPVDDQLEWEADRTQAQMRLLAVAAVLLLLLGGGWWWWSTQQETPVADADPATDPVEDPDAVVASVEDPAVEGDPVEGDPVEGDPVEGDPVEGDPVEADPVEGDPVEEPPEPVKPPPEPVKPPPEREPVKPPPEREPVKPPPKAEDPWDLIQSGKIGDARLGFVEQISRNPRDAEAHFGLGYAAQRQGDTATAVRSYCKALELAPSDNDIQREATSLVNSLQGSCD
jgi:hypothetical protein